MIKNQAFSATFKLDKGTRKRPQPAFDLPSYAGDLAKFRIREHLGRHRSNPRLQAAVLFCSGMRAAPAAVAVFLFAMGAPSVPAAIMTNLERQRLVAHLEMTATWLADEVSGLSPAQLHFHPAVGSWSILEVLDHLVVCEPIYWKNFQDAMNAPLVNRGPSSSDETVLWYGIDRTNRQKAVTAEDPNGRLKDVQTGLASFRKLRAEMLQYARTTKEDLRAHFVERERSDAYQWFLLISTHSQRHILQIREIKANPRFPRQ